MRALGWSDAGLVDGPADGLRQTPVDAHQRAPTTPRRALGCTAEHRDDIGIALALALLAQVDSGTRHACELTAQVWCREENDWFDVGQALPVQGFLPLQQRFQLFRFPIGEQQWIVIERGPAFVGPAPGASVTRHAPEIGRASCRERG